MKPTYRRSWDGNLLMFSDLTFCPSFKVKRWFTDFELSFRWIQIASVLRCVGLVVIWPCVGIQRATDKKVVTILIWKSTEELYMLQ